MTYLWVSVVTQNCASAKAGWTTGRAKILANRLLTKEPDIIYCEELYATERPLMESLLSGKYGVGSVHKGKVVFYLKTAYKKIIGSDRGFDLPNGKTAAGVKIESITTGKRINAVAAHLSWQHDYEAQRAAETKSLITQCKTQYPENRTLYAGDWNASLKFGDRTGDSVAKVMAAYGYRDLYKDVPVASRYYEEYNSANGFALPPPKDGIHLDRIFGGDVTGTAWRLDAYVPSTVSGYGSDHFAVGVTLRVPI